MVDFAQIVVQKEDKLPAYLLNGIAQCLTLSFMLTIYWQNNRYCFEISGKFAFDG